MRRFDGQSPLRFDPQPSPGVYGNEQREGLKSGLPLWIASLNLECLKVSITPPCARTPRSRTIGLTQGKEPRTAAWLLPQ